MLQHAAVLAETGLPFGGLRIEHVTSARQRGVEFAAVVEIGLLSVSLARAQTRRREARLWLEDLRTLHAECGISTGFRFHHEAGLNLLGEGDHYPALENFTKSIALSQNPIDAGFAKVNTLICLENLGLPHADLAAELEAELRTSGSDDPSLGPVRASFTAFGTRESFRQGEFRALHERTSASAPLNETRFLVDWANAMPFVIGSNHGAGIAPDLRVWTLAEISLYQQSYRLRTLLGQLHPDDAGEIRISEQIMRLYLWTWRWMIAPREFPFTKIAALLKSFPLWVADDFRLTSEDVLQLRNALHWIALFDRASVESLQIRLRTLERPGTQIRAPFYEFELNCIQTLQSRKQGAELYAQDFLVGLRSHPLWDRTDHGLTSLLRAALGEIPAEAVPAPRLRELATRLREICRPTEPPPLAGLNGETSGELIPELTIDASIHEISAARGQLKIQSESLCLALELLCREPSVSFEKFAFVCFGLRKFDRVIHQAKVLNLVARLRPILPGGCAIRSKQGVIHALGEWKKIRRKHTDEAILQISQAITWNAVKSEKLPAHRRQRFLTGHRLTRREFERLTGCPTSTATRTLKKLVASGKLVRFGQSRTIHYEVKKDFSL